MDSRTFFENKVLCKRVFKNPTFFVFKLSLFVDIYMKKQKGPETNYQSLFRLSIVFENCLYVLIHDLTNFNALTQ